MCVGTARLGVPRQRRPQTPRGNGYFVNINESASAQNTVEVFFFGVFRGVVYVFVGKAVKA